MQGFDKLNDFTGTSISKGEIYIKTFTLYICNTRVILKISECFFEWIISVIKLIVWIFGILSSSTVFEKKLLKTRHSSSSFEIVLFPSVKFIFSLFENLLEKSGTTVFQNVRLSVTFLMSKLLKQVLLVFFKQFTKISLWCIIFPIRKIPWF